MVIARNLFAKEVKKEETNQIYHDEETLKRIEQSRAGMEPGREPQILPLGKNPEEIHVLLVDDEKLSRIVVGNLLRKCNYQVTVASSGLEALDVLRRHQSGTFHLILTDVMMPDVDGIELLRHIRSDEAFNSMPVVMMSANEHTETVFECIRRGAEDYLLKPVTKKEVQYICQHVWRRQKQGNLSVPLMEADEAKEHEHEGQEAVPQASARPTHPNGAGQPGAPLEEPAAPLRGRRRGSGTLGADPSAMTPAAIAARDAASQLLADRVSSGANASSSQPGPSSGHAQASNAATAPARRQAGGEGGSMPLSVYFAHRKSLVNSTDSFRIFCAAVALLQAQHAKGEAVRVRPSRLYLAPNGTLEVGTCSQRQAEIEDKLYASPEELLHKPLSAASDIYSLGILFFELFNPVVSATERLHALSGLRHRILPLDLLQHRPQEASFVTSLLHPDPGARPTAAQLMQPKTLSALQRSICNSAEKAGKGRGSSDSVDVQVLLDFLKTMHTSKQTEAAYIKNHIELIDRDIQQVSQRLKELLAKGAGRQSEEGRSGSEGHSPRHSGSKRERDTEGEASGAGEGVTTSKTRPSFDIPHAEGESEERSKWTKIWDDNPVLEHIYVKRREAEMAQQRLMVAGPPEGCCAEEELEVRRQQELDHLVEISKDLANLAKRPSFEVKATLKYGDLMGEGDMVCSAAFDRDDEFFATAGVSKRIKVFKLSNVVEGNALLHYPVLEIGINSKISSLCWNSYVKSCLLAADYEGALQLWDVSSNAVTSQFEEHSKRIWSVDFSATDPTRFASGGDDGMVRLWSMRDYASTATIDSKANVCSVQLSPHNANLLAFGSANYRVYLYDLRKMASPLAVIGGHKKAVSYVRFLGGNRLVSASTDNTLKLWDIDEATSSQGRSDSLMTYSGHTNERNFVGLSVNSDGYIACGSESNEVFAYHHSLPLPLASHPFAMKPPRMDAELESRQFVSTVCWAHRGGNLLAANSAGVIKVLHLAS